MTSWLSSLVGQVLKRLKERNEDVCQLTSRFPDLTHLPPELSLYVLSYLNATDLCLAACVWRELAQDEVLWNSLCHSQWSHISLYNRDQPEGFSYHKLYLQLDEGTVTFNADAFAGMRYFFENNLVDNEPLEIAKFFHNTRALDLRQTRRYMNTRREILDNLIGLHNYENQFLSHALRRFFQTLQAPNEQNNYLRTLLKLFSARFCKCNPRLGMTTDTVYLLCFSLILLSVDLCSPHVKNKMSKREFIRNVRHAIQRSDDELYGHLYDDVYLRGHIAPNSSSD